MGKFVKDERKIRNRSGMDSTISRSCPEAVPELSRNWGEASTYESPTIPEACMLERMPEKSSKNWEWEYLLKVKKYQ